MCYISEIATLKMTNTKMAGFAFCITSCPAAALYKTGTHKLYYNYYIINKKCGKRMNTK